MVLDNATGKSIHQLTKHKKPVLSVAFSPDDRLLVSGGHDGTAIVWDAASGKELRTSPQHIGEVQSVAFRPDAKAVVSASYYASTGELATEVRVWDSRHRDRPSPSLPPAHELGLDRGVQPRWPSCRLGQQGPHPPNLGP